MQNLDAGGQETPYTRRQVKLLLTVPEAANALGLCRSLVYDLLVCGELQSVKIGRSRRIPLVALDEFIARKLAAAKQPA